MSVTDVAGDDEVTFVTPIVRPVSGTSSIGFVLLGLAGFASLGSADNSSVVGQVIMSSILVLVGLGLFVSIMKGYSVTVSRDRVVAHQLRNRILPIGELQGVETKRALSRVFQMRTCLCFHFQDGTSYTFKNFNGSLSPTSRSYANVVHAKELINQRIVDWHGGASVSLPSPTQPFGLGESGYDE